MNSNRYDGFLRAADIADDKERISSLMTLVQELPSAHFDLLERLIFHLTRVALNEKSNRMGTNALAIVFAPCILRTSRLQQAQDSLSNVSRQTCVLESILVEQLRRVTDTLADIDSLDSVCLAYAARLGTLRSSKMVTSSPGSSEPSSPPPLPSSPPPILLAEGDPGEERLIQEQLDELREEKAALAATLPSLARTASDDDLLSTDGDLDSPTTGGSVDDLPASTTTTTSTSICSDTGLRGIVFCHLRPSLYVSCLSILLVAHVRILSATLSLSRLGSLLASLESLDFIDV